MRLALPRPEYFAIGFVFVAIGCVGLWYDLTASQRNENASIFVRTPSCPFDELEWHSDALENSVTRHAAFFAHPNDREIISVESMTKGHHIQHIHDGVGLKVWAINNLLNERALPQTIHAFRQITNPASSGIWNSEGNFNLTAFNAFVSGTSFMHQGYQILTRDSVRRWFHQKYLFAGDSRWAEVATRIAWLLPVSWDTVTSGSFDELFRYFTDITYTSPSGVRVPALTVNQLLMFYTQPERLMERRRLGLQVHRMLF